MVFPEPEGVPEAATPQPRPDVPKVSILDGQRNPGSPKPGPLPSICAGEIILTSLFPPHGIAGADHANGNVSVTLYPSS